MPEPSLLRSVLHVDMDAFYAAVEQRDRPELRGRPVIVGALPQGGQGRGVVSTASYEARRFGVTSAMPISRAYKLCPQGVYLLPDMGKYVEVSRQVMAVLRRFTDLVEPISIDEAFLDVTGSRRAFGTGEEIAHSLKRAIVEETRLTASVGVATSKLVAKVASDLRKPDGLVIVPFGEEAAFFAPLPVRRLWGVGPKMEEQLAKLGVVTIGDLAALPPERLQRRFGTHGHDLIRLARGEDDRDVIGEAGDAKSVGNEHTYDRDSSDLRRLRATLLELSDHVASRLRRSGFQGRTVTLKYRDETFRTLTRAQTLEHPTDAGNVIFETAYALFERVHGALRVRLLGVSVSHLAQKSGDHADQIGLFAPDTKTRASADRLRDDVARRFGAEAITRASLLGRRERRFPSDRPPDRD